MPILPVEPNEGAYPHELVDAYVGKKLIVVGGARCVFQDLESLGVSGQNPNGFDVMTVNDITMHYDGPIEHVYSNDARWLPKWLAARRELLTRAYGNVKHIHTCGRGAKNNWPWPGHGTSSLGAVYCGLAMGYDMVVLCGVPLDDSGHYFDPPHKKTNFRREVGTTPSGHMQYWFQAKNKVFNNKVRSQSGRTRELLGAY